MHLAAFLNAGPMGTTGWRHPDADPGFLTAKYYRHVARVLEKARFDLAFIPLLQSASQTLDNAKRKVYYSQLQDLVILKLALALPLYEPEDEIAAANYVHGLSFRPLKQMPENPYDVWLGQH